MRALVQRVSRASVTVDGEVIGKIDAGLCVFVGVTHDDDSAKATKLANKVWNLRCFEDDNGAMNLAASDLGRPLLVISQFTLYGDTANGRRPSWIQAARPEQAEPLFTEVVEALRKAGAEVETGRFRTHMQVELVNDGPTTLTIEV